MQSTVSQTQTPQEKTEKRTRERSPETDNPAKEFLIYRNKQKTLSNPEYQQEDTVQTTIIKTRPFINLTEETSDSPSSSTPTEPLDTPHTMDVLKDSTDQNIFAKFRAIKQKNEALKSTTY